MSISDFFKKIFSSLVVGNCLGLLIVSVLLVVGGLFFVDFYTHHGKVIEVPDVRGLDENVARKKLEAMGLKMEVSDTGYVLRSPPFSVLEQSLKPGDEVKPGRIMLITINSDGPRQIAIPDLADNCSRREAEDKLRVLGFKLGTTEYVMGDPDWVLGVKVHGKNVAAGTKVSTGTPITLVVGAGGLEEEFNGNDSLDYILNAPSEEESEIIEGEASDAPSEEPLEEPTTASPEATAVE